MVNSLAVEQSASNHQNHRQLWFFCGSLTDQKLEQKLFRNYNKHIRPARTPGDVVIVNFYLTLLQLISIAEKSEEMTTSQYITFQWEDSRLHWNPEEFGGVESIRLPPALIWKPDVTLFNNNDGQYDKRIPVNVVLKHTGIVEWLPPAIYKSACSITVDYFPFDWQNCTMKFRSFTDNSSEVRLVSAYDKIVVDMEAYTDNGEWDIIHCPVKTNSHASSPQYQDLTLYLIIQRKPLFYIINIIVPCGLISSLSVLVFYLPSHCSEKMNMSISLLLGLPVYLLLLAKRVPETSLGVPLIGAYLLFIILSVTLSVICSVLVLHVYHKNPAKHKISPWVRRTFLHKLPPLLYLRTLKIHKLEDDTTVFKQRMNAVNNQRSFQGNDILHLRELYTKGYSVSTSSVNTQHHTPTISQSVSSSQTQNISSSTINYGSVSSCNGFHVSQYSNGTNSSKFKSCDHRRHRGGSIHSKSSCSSSTTRICRTKKQTYLDLPCEEKRNTYKSRGYRRYTNNITRRKSYRRANATSPSSSINSRRNDRNVTHGNLSESQEYKEAITSVIYMADHLQKQRLNKVASQEWHYVAMVMDRLFLCIFMFIFISGTMYFAVQALTNSPPRFPFGDNNYKYAGCITSETKTSALKTMFSWNG